MIEKDRITLTGDRIGHGRLSKVGAFLMSPTFYSAAIPTLFLVAARVLLSPDDPTPHVVEDAKNVFPFVALSVHGGAQAARKIVSATGGRAKDKVINMNPNEFTLPTTEKWLTAMANEGNSAKRDLISMIALTAVVMCVASMVLPMMGATTMTLRDGFLSMFGVGFPYFYQDAMRCYRAQKVLNFDWVIEDKGPPPEKVPAREKVRGVVQKLFPKTAPAGAS